MHTLHTTYCTVRHIIDTSQTNKYPSKLIKLLFFFPAYHHITMLHVTYSSVMCHRVTQQSQFSRTYLFNASNTVHVKYVKYVNLKNSVILLVLGNSEIVNTFKEKKNN